MTRRTKRRTSTARPSEPATSNEIGGAETEPPIVTFAVSNPADRELLGTPSKPRRAAGFVDVATAVVYGFAAAGVDPLDLGGSLHLATLALTELLLRLFGEPIDLILAQDRRVVSRRGQTDLMLTLGAVVGLFPAGVSYVLGDWTPLLTYAWRIAARLGDIWLRPLGSREQAEANKRINLPLAISIPPLAILSFQLMPALRTSPAIGGALYFALSGAMLWTGWRPDVWLFRARGRR